MAYGRRTLPTVTLGTLLQFLRGSKDFLLADCQARANRHAGWAARGVAARTVILRPSTRLPLKAPIA
jgi:hypothetical protein